MTWSTQRNWRHCTKCEALWFAGNATQSACPAGGAHADDGTNYSLLLDASSAPGQSGWRQCYKCHSLWFSGAATAGLCSIGGTHSSDARNYTVATDGAGQPNWVQCTRCNVIWFLDGGTVGVCPSGGPHDGSAPPMFTVVRVSSVVRIHTRVLVAPLRSIETMLQQMREIYAFGEVDVEWASNDALSLRSLEDVEIGECTLGGPVTDEQRDLFSHRNGIGANEVAIYFIRTTNPPANGCASHPAGQPGAVVATNATQWTLAHEVGHVLTLQHALSRKRLMYEATEHITDPPPDLILTEIATMQASPFTINL